MKIIELRYKAVDKESDDEKDTADETTECVEQSQ